IARSAVTRSLFGKEETMSITVTPTKTFIGTVTEYVPTTFTVESVEGIAELRENRGDAHTITWERQFTAGASVTLSYTFSVAEEGPLALSQFGSLVAKGRFESGEAPVLSSSSASSESSESS